MKVKFNEIGRSMLEMLGVLAVTGVLSVGGIMGYRFAMDKYRANETLNELQIRVADLSRQMQNGIIELSVDEMGNRTRMGYPIRAHISPQYPDYFEVFLDEVPSGVCRQLLKSQWTIPYSIFVGTTEYEIDASICNEAETVTLAYEFKDDLTEKKYIEEEYQHDTIRCNNDNDCKCATCQEGLCVSMCTSGSSCTIDFENASSYMCCLNSFTAGNLCCYNIDENGKCCNSNNICCPPETPLLDKDGKCYACDYEKGVNVSGMTQNCGVCPNRTVSANGYCGLKCGIRGTITENKPLKGTDGGCYACNEPKTISAENCSVCPERFSGTTNGAPNKNCFACGMAGTSVEDKPIAGLHGGCYSCETLENITTGVSTEEHRCEIVCPNRVADGYSYMNPICKRVSCPAEKQLEDKNGACHPCNETTSIDVGGDVSKCSKCLFNRKIEGDYCVLI